MPGSLEVRQSPSTPAIPGHTEGGGVQRSPWSRDPSPTGGHTHVGTRAPQVKWGLLLKIYRGEIRWHFTGGGIAKIKKETQLLYVGGSRGI